MCVLKLWLGNAFCQEAHVLRGNDWLQLDHSHKVMLVAGISQVLEMERHLVSEGYARDSASFIPPLVIGLQGMTIGEIVERIDDYYHGDAQAANNSVVDAIFRSIIYPRGDGSLRSDPLPEVRPQPAPSPSTQPNQ